MDTVVHFWTTDLRGLFHIIGSADRGLLQELGISFGTEFRPEDAEDEFEKEEDTPPPGEWDVEEAEADTSREIIAKMVMSGLPQDLAEDEAYAVQDFLASYTARSGQASPIDAETLLDETPSVREDADAAGAWARMLGEGAVFRLFGELLDFLREQDASHELLVRMQSLCFGRLPDADEPTFTDLEDDAYAARFGYLYAEEAAAVADELEERCEDAPGEVQVFGLLLAALFNHCNVQSADLVVTIED